MATVKLLSTWDDALMLELDGGEATMVLGILNSTHVVRDGDEITFDQLSDLCAGISTVAWAEAKILPKGESSAVEQLYFKLEDIRTSKKTLSVAAMNGGIPLYLEIEQ